jgi:hypothetical protein
MTHDKASRRNLATILIAADCVDPSVTFLIPVSTSVL